MGLSSGSAQVGVITGLGAKLKQSESGSAICYETNGMTCIVYLAPKLINGPKTS